MVFSLRVVFVVALILSIVDLSNSQSCRPRGVSGTGVCQNANSRSCSGGRYYKGACPGASNIQCCVKSSSSSSSDDDSGPSSGNSAPPSGGSGSVGSGWGTYQPPAQAARLLGNLFTSVRPTKTNWGYKGAKATFMLPGGAIYIDSKMDTDCDGARTCPSIDPYGQTQTSWTWKGSPIDALKTNYYVLPSNLRGRLGSTKLGLGDIAAVIYNGKLEFAVYADNGPNNKIGEGSVKLVQNLGFNPYRNGKICCGIQSGVVIIVLPGSRGTYSSPYDRESVRQAGLQRLNALTGSSSRAVGDNNSQYNSDESTSTELSPGISAVIAIASIVVVVFVILAIMLVVKHQAAQRANEQRP